MGSARALVVGESYQSAVLADNPTAYFRLNDLGTAAVDQKGGPSGVISATGVTRVQGATADGDGALAFDGATGVVTVADNPAHNFGLGSFSVEMWVNLPDLPTNPKWYYGKGNPYSDQTPGWSVESWDTVSLSPAPTMYFSDGVLGHGNACTSASLLRGSWGHVVFTVDRAGAIVRSYINGVAGATVGISGLMGSMNTALAMTIGQGNTNPYTGSLDEFALYGYVLTPAQVALHYRLARQPTVVGSRRVQSVGMLGGNLLANDHAQSGNNSNFSAMVYDAVNMRFGHASFKLTGDNLGWNSDALMPIDPMRRYLVSYWAKSSIYVPGSHAYLGLTPYDTDGLQVQAVMVMWIPNTLTTLAAPLAPGATTVTLTSAANWWNADPNYSRSLLIWDYVDGRGYKWPPLTYTRHNLTSAWGLNGIVGNVITLSAPWVGFGQTIPAGTPVSNGTAGNNNMYSCLVNGVIPADWTPFPGVVLGGYDTTGNAPNVGLRWWPGTAKVRMLLLPNRDVAGNVTNITDMVLQQADPGGAGSNKVVTL